MSGVPVCLGRRTRVPSRDEVLHQIRYKPGATVFAIARALQKPQAIVFAVLQELVASGAVRQDARGYFVVEM